MQTFLPYDDYTKSVDCLDNKRLGKQRVETFQILNVLEGTNSKTGWRNHPAVLMWSGHTDALAEYLDHCIVEWCARGFNNTMLLTGRKGPKPTWFGDQEFHASHRANLLRKDFSFYSRYGWTEDPGLPYVWPVRKV